MQYLVFNLFAGATKFENAGFTNENPMFWWKHLEMLGYWWYMMAQGGLPTKKSGKTGDFSTKQRGFICDFVIATVSWWTFAQVNSMVLGVLELKQRYSLQNSAEDMAYLGESYICQWVLSTSKYGSKLENWMCIVRRGTIKHICPFSIPQAWWISKWETRREISEDYPGWLQCGPPQV